MKVKESQLWKTEIALEVANKLKSGGKLLTKITHVNRNSGAWRYEVSLAYAGPNGVELMALTYWLAACTGDSLHNGELRNGEVGTERNFLVAWNVWRVLASFGFVEKQFTNQAIYRAI